MPDLKLSPNPVTTSVRLDLETAGSGLTLSLFSIEGKAIFKAVGTLQQVNERLNAIITTLPPSTYVINVTDNHRVYNKKLIKQ